MSFLGKVQSAVENGLNWPPIKPSSKISTVKRWEQSTGRVSLWERAATTNTRTSCLSCWSWLQPNYNADASFIVPVKKKVFTVSPRKGSMYTWGCLLCRGSVRAFAFEAIHKTWSAGSQEGGGHPVPFSSPWQNCINSSKCFCHKTSLS